LIPAVLAPISLPLVDDAFVFFATSIRQVLPHGAFEESFAPLAAVDSVMFSTGAIAANGAQMLRTAEWMVGRIIWRVLYVARIIHHSVPVDAV
jgi:hypothetical protein